MRAVYALAFVCTIGCHGDPVGETSGDASKGGTASMDGSAAKSGSGGSGLTGGSGGSAGDASSSGGVAGTAGTGGTSASGGSGGVLVPGPDGAEGIALDDTFVYFGVGKEVWRAPKTGGSKTLVTTGQVKVREVAVAGGFVYFLDGDKSIRRALVSGETPTLVTQGSGSFEEFGDFATDGSYVYFTTTLDKVNFAGSILRVSVTGGVPFEIHKVISAGEPRGIALFNGDVFWTQHLNGMLYKAPTNGGTATALATGLNGPWKVAPNATLVYWTETNGSAAYKEYGSIEMPVPAGGPGDDIVIDDANVYFSSPSAGKVFAAPLKSTSVVTLAECSLPGALALDATALYVACNGTPGAVLKIMK